MKSWGGVKFNGWCPYSRWEQGVHDTHGEGDLETEKVGFRILVNGTVRQHELCLWKQHNTTRSEDFEDKAGLSVESGTHA